MTFVLLQTPAHVRSFLPSLNLAQWLGGADELHYTIMDSSPLLQALSNDHILSMTEYSCNQKEHQQKPSLNTLSFLLYVELTPLEVGSSFGRATW